MTAGVRNPDPMIMPVMDRACAECLFSPRKIVNDTRKEQILQECKKTGRAFICHEATIVGEYRVCRLFFDGNYGEVVNWAKKLGAYKLQGLKE